MYEKTYILLLLILISTLLFSIIIYHIHAIIHVKENSEAEIISKTFSLFTKLFFLVLLFVCSIITTIFILIT
jgi:hypothetical protein